MAEIDENIFEVKIDIADQLSEQTGIPKQKIAEYLADALVKWLCPSKPPESML